VLTKINRDPDISTVPSDQQMFVRQIRQVSVMGTWVAVCVWLKVKVILRRGIWKQHGLRLPNQTLVFCAKLHDFYALHSDALRLGYFAISRKLLTRISKIKVTLSLYRPWGPLGLREVEACTFSNNRLIGGGKVVSLMRRPPITPPPHAVCGYAFLVVAEATPGPYCGWKDWVN
jgi:hypothetical protein